MTVQAVPSVMLMSFDHVLKKAHAMGFGLPRVISAIDPIGILGST